MCSVHKPIIFIMILIVYVSTLFLITQGNYVGYMFRLLNSHLQAYSFTVKSQDAVHTEFSVSVLQNYTPTEMYFAPLNMANVQIRYRWRLKWRQKKTTASNLPIVAIDVTTSLSLTGNRDWVLCIEYEVFI